MKTEWVSCPRHIDMVVKGIIAAKDGALADKILQTGEELSKQLLSHPDEVKLALLVGQLKDELNQAKELLAEERAKWPSFRFSPE
jgi:hypothetical protein